MTRNTSHAHSLARAAGAPLLALLCVGLGACGGRSSLSEFELGDEPLSVAERAPQPGEKGSDGAPVSSSDGAGDGDGPTDAPDTPAGEGPEEGGGGIDVGVEPPAQGGEIGSACETDDDCDAGTCASEIGGGFSPPEAPDGYCTAECEQDEDCGEGNACVGASFLGPGQCMAGCEEDEDCREGYECQGSGGFFGGEQVFTCAPPRPDFGGGFDSEQFCSDRCPPWAVERCVRELEGGGFSLPEACRGGGGGFGN